MDSYHIHKSQVVNHIRAYQQACADIARSKVSYNHLGILLGSSHILSKDQTAVS